MRRAGTADDYARRIERVVRHLEMHLDEPLDVQALADVACWSPFHFHRLWRHLTGLPIGETLRFMRLHRAAGDLVGSSASLRDISRRAGYGSTEAFGRAFAAAYGTTPASYRTKRSLVGTLPHSTSEGDPTMSYDVTIRDLEPLRVAAMPHRGSYAAINTSFQKLAGWANAHGLLAKDAPSYAVYYDDPGSVAEAELRSDACFAVPEGTNGQGDIVIKTIAGGRHATLLHRGPYAELERAYRWLLGTWLPQSGEEMGDSPCYEAYLNDPRALPPSEWLTEIRMPLASP